jgi:hypothetical protein
MNHEAKGQMATKNDLDNLKEYLDIKLESKLSLSAIGSIAVILILITRKNINKQIKNLIRL